MLYWVTRTTANLPFTLFLSSASVLPMNKTLAETLDNLPMPAMISGQLGWAVQIAVVLVLTLLVSLLSRRLLRTGASPSSLREGVVIAARAPLRLFIWLGGIGVMLDIIQAQYRLSIIDTLLALRPSLHIIILCWFLLRLNAAMPKVLALKERAPSPSTTSLIEKIFAITILTVGMLMILPTFGISVSGILAFGGIGGIVVGMAAKDMLSNFFGAMMIHLDRPFAVGDWVSLPEKSIEGDVEHIGWRQVVIRTFDKRQVFIPNALLSNIILVNPGRMTHRRILETIGIRYDDIEKLPAIVEEVKQFLQQHKALDQAPGVVVNMNAFSAYSVDFVVSAYTKKTKWADFLPIKQDVLLEINKIITRHQAAIAFPTQLVYTQSSHTSSV